MIRFDQKSLNALDRIKKLNIVNSITGIKPANLIGTKSAKGIDNLAIFSSVFHMGSNPPLIGMLCRPSGEVRRDTYTNIKATGFYTINHVPISKTKAAHQTSAKYEEDESEFETCGFEAEFLGDFSAPFVKEASIKMGLVFRQEIPIELNGTVLLIGEIQELYLPEEALSEEGYLNLEMANSAGVSGLNSYYSFEKIGDYPYARK